MIFTQLQTSPQGLTQEEAEKRLKTYGLNLLKAKKRTPYIIQFLEEFKDLMVIILIIATIFAFASGEITDAIIILFIVVLNATIGFVQKFKAEKAIEALKKMIKPHARVIREGKQKKILAEYLVPGDILVLEEGDTISADAVLFEVNELETQESILTGESISIQKTAARNHNKEEREDQTTVIYMGTMVTHGTGKAIVKQTGMNTSMGKIATLTTETKKDKSPLEKEIQNIGLFVGKITLGMTGLLFILEFFVEKHSFVNTLLFATSVAVAAVPEGLPATITIALAIGVQRLAKNNAIVKQLSSVETLGATTVICTDKTGTLTKNEMTVKELYFDRYNAMVKGVGYNPHGTIHIEKADKSFIIVGKLSEQYEGDALEVQNLETLEQNSPTIYEPFHWLLLAAGLCNNASLEQDGSNWKVLGDPTEAALIALVKKSGLDLEELRKRFEKIHEYPFDSTRKRMSVLLKDTLTDKFYLFSKGAPAEILDICSHVILNHHSMKIDEDTEVDFIKKTEQMASNALRCLGFAYRELNSYEIKEIETQKKEEVEKNMIFLGLSGMADPPRPEVKEAIELAHKAGIKIYIVTGDHGLTAEAIARQIGLLNEKKQHMVIFGDQLEKMKSSELKKWLGKKEVEIIFARVSPEHKLKIVSALKELGEVVAVTGDGVNDAPALKRADIGIAMGISGTDVSKEAANMILSDDSFATIISAIKEGRTIYENLKKFIFYIFSSNIGEVLIVFSAIIMKVPAPLTAVLILFINLTTDVLPAIALGVEPAQPMIMSKKPRNPHQKILSRNFIGRIFYIGGFMALIVMSVYMWNLYQIGWSWEHSSDKFLVSDFNQINSLAFVLLTMIQMANTLNARSEEESILRLNLFSNPKLLWAIVSSILLTVVMVELPLAQQYFHTAPLSLLQWLIVIVAACSIILFEELRKFIARKIS